MAKMLIEYETLLFLQMAEQEAGRMKKPIEAIWTEILKYLCPQPPLSIVFYHIVKVQAKKHICLNSLRGDHGSKD